MLLTKEVGLRTIDDLATFPSPGGEGRVRGLPSYLTSFSYYLRADELTAAVQALSVKPMNSVKTLEQVEAAVRKLSPQEQERLYQWLEDLLEDRLELTDTFKADIEAGKKDIAEGRVRIRKP